MGSFLQLTGAVLSATNFAVTVDGSGTTVAGTIGLSATNVTLFPGSTVFTTLVSGFSISYNFGSGGDGSLEISVASLR